MSSVVTQCNVCISSHKKRNERVTFPNMAERVGHNVMQKMNSLTNHQTDRVD